MRPPGRISSRQQTEKITLDDFDLAGDLKNLPRSQINSLQPIIQQLTEQAAGNALAGANLILSK
jgi:hypothetical protein